VGTRGHRGVGIRCAGPTALKRLEDGRVCGPRVKGLRGLSVGGGVGHDFAHLVDEVCISQPFAMNPPPHPGAGSSYVVGSTALTRNAKPTIIDRYIQTLDYRDRCQNRRHRASPPPSSNKGGPLANRLVSLSRAGNNSEQFTFVGEKIERCPKVVVFDICRSGTTNPPPFCPKPSAFFVLVPPDRLQPMDCTFLF
jgi:hypothetical protein